MRNLTFLFFLRTMGEKRRNFVFLLFCENEDYLGLILKSLH